MDLDVLLGAVWPAAVRLLDGLTQAREDRGEYAKARRPCERALRILERGPQTPGREKLRLRALSHLGALDRIDARYDQAEARLREALAIANVVFGGERPARRAVQIREQALGPDHLDVAADAAALAAILDGLGRYAESEPLYRRALAIFERRFGPTNYEIAVNLNNLAAVCQATGRGGEAERLYARALAIKEALLGPDHPDMAMSLNNLAVLRRAQGRPVEAEALYRRALSIFELGLSANHPKVAACRGKYAALVRERSKP
jgi:tetratricopeptide (TPR) repeat protein